MNELPSQSRRGIGKSESSDGLGSVPDGYTRAPDPLASSWQSGITTEPIQQETPLNPATTQQGSASKSAGRAFREVLETVLLAAVIFFGVRLLVLNFKVDGLSMMPNLHNSELLLVNRNAYSEIDVNNWINKIPFVDRDGSLVIWEFDPPERGDIIVFNPPNGDDKPYIKRVLATAGETVEIKDGSVWVDGVEVNEPYIKDGITECLSSDCGPVLIPEGQVWVMGDNRRNSSDSRAFGPVPIENIIGKAIVTYWPVSDIGLVPHYDYPEISE